MTIREAAGALAVAPKTVRRMIRRGELPARVVPGSYGPTYDIDQADVERAKQTVQTGALALAERDRATAAALDVLRVEIRRQADELHALRDELRARRRWWPPWGHR